MTGTARRRTGLLGLLLIVAGAALQPAAWTTAAKAEDQPGAATAPFHWPAPAEVVVASEAAKEDQAATTRFRLVIEPASGDGGISVQFKDFEFVSFGGEPVDTPEERAALAPVLAMTSMMPGFRIGKDGELLSLTDFDWDRVLTEMRAAVVAAAPSNPEAEAQFDQIVQQLRSPQMQAQAAAKIGDLWNVWVGLWRNVSMSDTAPQTLVSTVPIFDRQLEHEVVVRHLGPDDRCPGCLRLQADAVLEGPAFTEAMLATIREQFVNPNTPNQAKDQFEAFAATVEGFRRETRMEVVTDPATLRPAFAASETRMILRVRNTPANERLERTTWTFDWPEGTK